MTVDQTLQQEIKESQLWISRTNEESPYKRNLTKKIEPISIVWHYFIVNIINIIFCNDNRT